MGRDNLSVVLAERPKAEIIAGQTFNQKTAPAPTSADLKDGEILVEVLYLSLDPAMRGWLNGELEKKLSTDNSASEPHANSESAHF